MENTGLVYPEKQRKLTEKAIWKVALMWASIELLDKTETCIKGWTSVLFSFLH